MALGPTFALSDDVGTHYRYFGGGAFADEGAIRMEALYVPAPPDTATTLAVSYRGERVSIRLP